jgi:hypothetical protein
LGTWGFETMAIWDHGALGIRGFGTMGLGTLGLGAFETLPPRDYSPWDFGLMGLWPHGNIAPWDIGHMVT